MKDTGYESLVLGSTGFGLKFRIWGLKKRRDERIRFKEREKAKVDICYVIFRFNVLILKLEYKELIIIIRISYILFIKTQSTY